MKKIYIIVILLCISICLLGFNIYRYSTDSNNITITEFNNNNNILEEKKKELDLSNQKYDELKQDKKDLIKKYEKWLKRKEEIKKLI